MDPILIIANVLSLIGNTLFTLSAILKSKKKILLFQSANHVLSGISEYLTAAYTGLVQEVAAITRNIIFLFIKTKNKVVKLVISVVIALIAAILGVIFNLLLSNGIWYGYLPIIGSLIYSTGVILAFVLNTNELNCEIILKLGLGLNAICWGIYGIIVMLYPVTIFNVLNIILCIVSIVRVFILKHKDKKLKEEAKGNE